MTKDSFDRCPGCGMRTIPIVEWSRKAKRIIELETKVEQLEKTKAEYDDYKAKVSKLEDWTHQHGAALCPPGGMDTYGNGMRDAKEQVHKMLRNNSRSLPTKRT